MRSWDFSFLWACICSWSNSQVAIWDVMMPMWCYCNWGKIGGVDSIGEVLCHKMADLLQNTFSNVFFNKFHLRLYVDQHLLLSKIVCWPTSITLYRIPMTQTVSLRFVLIILWSLNECSNPFTHVHHHEITQLHVKYPWKIWVRSTTTKHIKARTMCISPGAHFTYMV